MQGPDTTTRSNTLTRSAYLAAAAPVVCAVHCIAAPLLVLFSPVFHLNPVVEYGIMASAALLSILFLRWGVVVHGNRLVWLPALAGLGVWIGGEAVLGHTAGGLWLHGAGSMLLAAGLVWNAGLRHAGACGDCGCPVHEKATAHAAAD